MIVVCPFFLAIFGWGGSGVWTVLLLGFGVVVGIKVLGYRVWSLGVGFFWACGVKFGVLRSLSRLQLLDGMHEMLVRP